MKFYNRRRAPLLLPQPAAWARATCGLRQFGVIASKAGRSTSRSVAARQADAALCSAVDDDTVRNDLELFDSSPMSSGAQAEGG